MNYSYELSRRLPRSKRIRRSMIPLISLYVQFAEKANRLGCMSLEETHREYTSTIVNREITMIFHRSIEWVLDSYDEEMIRQNFSALLNSKKWSSRELLALILISEGACFLKEGGSSSLVEQRLLCWIGYDSSPDYYKEDLENQKAIADSKMIHWLKKEFLEGQNERVKEPGFIDRIFALLDEHQTFYGLLREFDSRKINSIIVTLRKETIEHYLNYISIRTGIDALNAALNNLYEYTLAISIASPQDTELEISDRDYLTERFERLIFDFSLELAFTIIDKENAGKVYITHSEAVHSEISKFLEETKKKKPSFTTEKQLAMLSDLQASQI